MFSDIGFVLLYRNFVSNPSNSLCKGLDDASLFINIVGVILAEGILVLRTYAIWNSSKKIAWIFGGILFAILVGVLGFVIKATEDQRYGPSPSPSAFPGCFLIAANRQVWIGIFLTMLFETAVVITTLYKVFQQWKYREAASNLVHTIYRDGISFFILLFAVSLLNIIVVRTAPDALAFMFTSLHRVLHASLTERIILNIRRAAERNKFSQISDGSNPTGGAIPEFGLGRKLGAKRVKPDDSMELSSVGYPTLTENSRGDREDFLSLEN